VNWATSYASVKFGIWGNMGPGNTLLKKYGFHTRQSLESLINSVSFTHWLKWFTDVQQAASLIQATCYVSFIWLDSRSTHLNEDGIFKYTDCKKYSNSQVNVHMTPTCMYVDVLWNGYRGNWLLFRIHLGRLWHQLIRSIRRQGTVTLWDGHQVSRDTAPCSD
jgi:hypothetical protein